MASNKHNQKRNLDATFEPKGEIQRTESELVLEHWPKR